MPDAFCSIYFISWQARDVETNADLIRYLGSVSNPFCFPHLKHHLMLRSRSICDCEAAGTLLAGHDPLSGRLVICRLIARTFVRQLESHKGRMA